MQNVLEVFLKPHKNILIMLTLNQQQVNILFLSGCSFYEKTTLNSKVGWQYLV